MEARDSNDIFSQVKALDLPLGSYAVVGSGVMSAFGIRQHQDIDLVVTQGLYDELQRRGWKKSQAKPGIEVVVSGIAEAGPKMMDLKDYHPDIAGLIRRAYVIKGAAFASLPDVMDFKKAFGREKDIRDLGLISDFLARYPDPLSYFKG
jgi:hypothetical protein